MKLEWIEDFLEVGTLKSFALAAERRGISRSALWRRIRGLEDWVGVPLCEPASAQVRLTPAGEAFSVVAEGAVRKLYQQRAALQEKLSTRDETVVFAAAQGVASRLFPPWLHMIEESLGPLRYRLFIDRLLLCMEEFTAGRADFLLCYRFPRVVSAFGLGAFSYFPIGSETFLPVCAPDGEGGPRCPLDGPAIEDPLPLLAYNPDAGLSRAVAGLLEGSGGRPYRVAFESNFGVVLKAMVLEGRGLAWLAEADVQGELASGRLCRAGGRRWDITVEARLYRPDRPLPRAAETLWAAITARKPRTAS